MGERIEPKPFDVPAAAETLLAALRHAEKREITVADAGALSGLPLDHCEAALIHLGRRLSSRIRTTSRGELLFTFDSLAKKREGRLHRAFVRARGALRVLADNVVAALTFIAVPDLLLVAAAQVFALASVISDLPTALEILLLPPLAVVFFLLFATGFIGWVVTQVVPALGLLCFSLMFLLSYMFFLEAYETRSAWPLLAQLVLLPICVKLSWNAWTLLRDVRSGKTRPFTEQTLAKVRGLFRGAAGFLLGPPPLDRDGLDDERRVVAYLRAHHGVLTTAELMALFGATREEAERETTRILADYGGDIDVTEDGALVFRFASLMRTTRTTAPATDTRPAWLREAAPPRFFDCPPWVAAAVLIVLPLASLGLAVHPELVTFPTRAYYEALDLPAGGWFYALLEGFGAWPYLVSLVLLLTRLPFHVRARLRHRARERLLALLREAHTRPAGVEVRDVDTKLLVAIDGAIDAERTRDDGLLHLVFERTQRELAAAKAARESATSDEHEPFEVVFDSRTAGE